MKPEISIVIPVYNEAGNVIPLYKELKNVLTSMNTSFEIIFVNDCSTDTTLQELESLEGIRIVNHIKNSGQSASFDSGFKAADGDIIVTLDGDGQNDPKDIPALVHKLKSENLDVVTGWRKNRHDKKSIVLISYIGRMVRFVLFGDKVHDAGCSLKAYRRKVFKDITLTGKMHRYILIILKSKGFKIGETVVNHRPRTRGQSKYNASKMWEGMMDLLRLRFGEKLLKMTAISLIIAAIVILIYYFSIL